jgi:hypothetical protein
MFFVHKKTLASKKTQKKITWEADNTIVVGYTIYIQQNDYISNYQTRKLLVLKENAVFQSDSHKLNGVLRAA